MAIIRTIRTFRDAFISLQLANSHNVRRHFMTCDVTTTWQHYPRPPLLKLLTGGKTLNAEHATENAFHCVNNLDRREQH
jgi:hypothetical protein